MLDNPRKQESLLHKVIEIISEKILLWMDIRCKSVKLKLNYMYIAYTKVDLKIESL